jgi:DNA-binding NarL/FixJ family response regulator
LVSGVVAMVTADRAMVATRSALGASRFDTGWATGRRLMVAAAIAEVEQVRIPEGKSPAVLDNLHLLSRERDVLKLLAPGALGREIVRTQFLGVCTVEAHVASLPPGSVGRNRALPDNRKRHGGSNRT